MSVASSRMKGREFVTTNLTIHLYVGPRRYQRCTGCSISRAFFAREMGSFNEQTAGVPLPRSRSRSRQPRQQSARLAKPGPFPTPQISRHSRLLGEDFLRPIARFGDASLRLQEQRVVVIGFRDGRNPRRLAKHRIRFLDLSGLRVGPGQQPLGTMKVVIRIGSDGALQVGYSRRKVPEFNLSDSPAVKRVDMVGSRRNGLVVTRARPRIVAVVQIKQSQFFVVSRRRIVEDDALQFVDAPPPWKYLEGTAQQPRVRNHFDDDINQSPNRMNQDHPYPEIVRPPPDEVDNRHHPQQYAPP